jgi:hypothetical protein
MKKTMFQAEYLYILAFRLLLEEGHENLARQQRRTPRDRCRLDLHALRSL